jgi:hypothetical protein
MVESFAIHIGGFELSEPVTAISDLLLTLICWRIVMLLGRAGKQSAFASSWQLFYAGMSFSFLTGVLVHGIRHYQTESEHYQTWMVMNIISGASTYFAQIGTTRSILKNLKAGKLLRISANFQIVGYLIIVVLLIGHFNFGVVKTQIAIGLLPVMAANFMQFRKGKVGGAWIGFGIAVSFFSVIFHTFKLSISEHWFNYNDISHIFLCVSLILMFKGIRIQLEEEQSVRMIPVVEK